MLLVSPVQAYITKYSPQVGARGDDASKDNSGVRAEIRTHTYLANYGDFDYFWVGDNLADGSFIQFGYGFEPGYFCLRWINEKCVGRSDNLGISDARWQWQYWSNASVGRFNNAIGPSGSAGENATWHSYAIVPDAVSWSFVLDGLEVDRIDIHPVKSVYAAYVVAEKATNSAKLGRLGPVEFRNLTYLADNVWHPVNSLVALVGHAILAEDVTNPYGVAADGPNHIIAGTSVAQPKDHQLLWSASGQPTLTNPLVLMMISIIRFSVWLLIVAVVVLAIIFQVQRGKRRNKS